MLVELSPGWLVLVNITAWAVIHLGLAFGLTQLSQRRFDPDGWLFRARRWERGGESYERWLRVSRWKRRLPDGAALFRRGFRKKRLTSHARPYLERFARETCRGELVHWAVMLAAPLFFLWNPGWVGGLMLLYAAVASLPFIVVQRHNRFRLQRMLRRRAGSRQPRGGTQPSAADQATASARWGRHPRQVHGALVHPSVNPDS